MDPELKAYLDHQFARIEERDGRLEGRMGGLEGRVGGLEDRVGGLEDRISGLGDRVGALEDAVRQTRVVMEGQRDDIKQVAEGVIGMNERLDSFRDEMALQFDQVRSLISPPYSDLNRRVKTLESWRERTERDPVEMVREMFGKPKH